MFLIFVLQIAKNMNIYKHFFKYQSKMVHSATTYL